MSQRSGSSRRREKKESPPAGSLPVARVAVDVSLPHLDRPFDYLVPARLDGAAVPGCRVRVRFAGRLLDGYLLERVASSDHEGRLTPLSRVVSAEPVLAPDVVAIARRIADRYAGTLADVLRLAVPPRHARVEAEPSRAVAPRPTPPPPGPWEEYAAGPSFVKALADGRVPRAVWSAVPGASWPEAVAGAVHATLASGRGALVVVPDGRDAARVDTVLRGTLGAGHHVTLTADLGPAERYRRWLAVRRGAVPAVVGTRAAAFAPVARLGLAVCWDDGDDLHAERRAPYPHAREVIMLRAHLAQSGALIGGFARTCESTRLVATGWAHPLGADRTVVRRVAPMVRVAGDDAELARDEAARTARLPTLAWRIARDALISGPVLVHVPRRGYLPALACARCWDPARCVTCNGPLRLVSSLAAPSCRWCGRLAGSWRCPSCGAARVRALVTGTRRTAEELGRAFPSVPVRTSGRDGVLAEVPPSPALVVSTPGAEPMAGGGYAAALLLDGHAALARADLRAAEEALRRWMNAAGLVRRGGRVVVLADGALPPVQALVRWDPVAHAERELAEREALGFPPAACMAALTGAPGPLGDLLSAAELPASAQVLGPVPSGGDDERMLVRVPRQDRLALARALHTAQAVRSARRGGGGARVQVDPLDLI
ncbi:MAG: primosomal protein N' [Streptosporangiaceae bacterium]